MSRVSPLCAVFCPACECVRGSTVKAPRCADVRATPKKITRLVRESVAALRGNGILADTYRSNGKRWISLKRADRADFLPVKTIGTIDPAGVPSTCTVP